MREIFLMCLTGNACALAVAVIYCWGTPFASGVSARDRLGFTVWIVLCCFVFGFVGMIPLVAHFLRSPSVSMIQAIRLLLRRSCVDITIYSAFGTTAVASLLYAGLPVVEYNVHSAITTLVFSFGSMRLMANAASIHRRQHLQPAASTAVHSVTVTTAPKTSPPRSSSWRRTLQKTCSVGLPSAVSVIIMTQYFMLGRRAQFTRPATFLLFSIGSTLLKTLLPIATKLFMAKSHTRNARNSLFMLVTPIMHVEIQMRMAVTRGAYNNSTPVYVSSAIVNILEIVMRVATVVVDIAFVHRARRRKDRDQQAAIHAANTSTGHGDDKAKDVALAARLQELDTEFTTWKREHLRNCSNEILAEMAAEYCSIGVVALYMVVLHGNRSIDLPASSAASLSELVHQQLVALVTQVAFEIVTDVLAIFIEIRAGIPLLDTLQHDHERFLRWVIPVSVIHACGLCLSSLVVFE